MKKALWIVLAFFLLGATAARAVVPSAGQPVPAPAAAKALTAGKAPADVKAPAQDNEAESLDAPFHGSFFLTPLEITAIEQAMNNHVVKHNTLAIEKSAIPEHRIIRVAGVFYRSAKDWIVWMNGQKVTPDNLLPQIISIQVSPSSSVHLKWYDIGLNKVISLTMYPNETYDIPTGILLPGAH